MMWEPFKAFGVAWTLHDRGEDMADPAKQIAERIRHKVDTYTAAFPALLEIPSKDHPYDPEKDSVLRRVRRLFGE